MKSDRVWRVTSHSVGFWLLIIAFSFVCGLAAAANNTTDSGTSSGDFWWIGLAMVIIGAILLVFELSSPGFFIAIPGTIMIVLGFIGMLFPDLFNFTYGIIIAMVVAGITSVVVILLYRRLAPPEPPTTTVGESLVGEVGRITVATDPDRPTKGKVQIGSEVWSASSDKRIPVGKKVEVVRSEGVHVHVEEIE